ncbi:MAG: hypothetical protein AB7L09_02415 [Nitrospira sp.]
MSHEPSDDADERIALLDRALELIHKLLEVRGLDYSHLRTSTNVEGMTITINRELFSHTTKGRYRLSGGYRLSVTHSTGYGFIINIELSNDFSPHSVDGRFWSSTATANYLIPALERALVLDLMGGVE